MLPYLLIIEARVEFLAGRKGGNIRRWSVSLFGRKLRPAAIANLIHEPNGPWGARSAAQDDLDTICSL